MSIAVVLLFPILLQINKGIFRDPSIYFRSGGALTNLPIPSSVLACYGGIVLLGSYKRALSPFSTIFFTCMLMMMSAIISTQINLVQQQAKLVLLIQFILPMFALVLGQIYNPVKIDNNPAIFEKMFLYVLDIIIPLELLFTWNHGYKFLVPSLSLFSIYQHLQYVPVVFVSAYLVALFALWQLQKYRYLLLMLAPLMAIYATASMSMLAIGMLLMGVLGLAVYQWKSNLEKLPALVFLLVAVMSWSYLQY